MEWNKKSVEEKGAILSYFSKGGIGVPVIAFHGFGMSSTDVSTLSCSYAKGRPIILVNLFFHGESKWNHEIDQLTHQHWKSLLNRLFKEESIPEFDLLAFSLGGRFALYTYMLFPDRVKELVLLAPDGLKTGFWYSLNSYPGWMKPFFRKAIDNPKRYFRLVRFFRRIGLVGKGVSKFAEEQMSTREGRSRFYYTWVVFEPIKIQLKSLVEQLNESSTSICLITGKYDKIVPTRKIGRILNKVKTARSVELESGHTGLIKAAEKYFTEE